MPTLGHRGATREQVHEWIFALLTLVPTGAVHAQSRLARNVSIVVPYLPGSGPDVLARALANCLVSTTGKTVIVANRARANALDQRYSSAKTLAAVHAVDAPLIGDPE